MSRPSQNIDKKLIEIGKKKMIENGISNISIRSICAEAGVNLGMFHYCFKSKENFIKILFQGVIQDLHDYWVNWIKETEDLPTSKERLEKIIFINAKLFREKKDVFESIMKSFDFSNDLLIKFVKENRKTIDAFFFAIVEDCKKDGYLNKDISNFKLVSILFGATMTYAKYCVELFVKEEQYDAEILQMTSLLMQKCK
ncbi:MAG: TetR/AcrR family transcriptional regulator [Endomicrobium sp.]|jgi:AcrR family transcriptional regulator|nr:TetR/AcrR family transcriptional regulator [Endomicrobium sp.]